MGFRSFTELRVSLLYQSAPNTKWVNKFLSSCMPNSSFQKFVREHLWLLSRKQISHIGDPKSYRPISLRCVHFKILESLSKYTHVKPVTDPLLPREQARFQRGRSMVDQVTLLTPQIEYTFSAEIKAGAVFVDLTADYGAVWHRSHIWKLLCFLPDRHMSCWLCNLFVIKTLPSPPVPENKVGYDALKTASPKISPGSPLV